MEGNIELYAGVMEGYSLKQQVEEKQRDSRFIGFYISQRNLKTNAK